MSEQEYNKLSRHWWLTIVFFGLGIVAMFFAIRTGSAWVLGVALVLSSVGYYHLRQHDKIFTLK